MIKFQRGSNNEPFFFAGFGEDIETEHDTGKKIYARSHDLVPKCHMSAHEVEMTYFKINGRTMSCLHLKQRRVSRTLIDRHKCF